jgi:hypothetical protein
VKGEGRPGSATARWQGRAWKARQPSRAAKFEQRSSCVRGRQGRRLLIHHPDELDGVLAFVVAGFSSSPSRSPSARGGRGLCALSFGSQRRPRGRKDKSTSPQPFDVKWQCDHSLSGRARGRRWLPVKRQRCGRFQYFLAHLVSGDVSATPKSVHHRARACHSLPFSANVCHSLPMSANLCQCLPISANLCQCLPFSAIRAVKPAACVSGRRARTRPRTAMSPGSDIVSISFLPKSLSENRQAGGTPTPQCRFSDRL